MLYTLALRAGCAGRRLIPAEASDDWGGGTGRGATSIWCSPPDPFPTPTRTPVVARPPCSVRGAARLRRGTASPRAVACRDHTAAVQALAGARVAPPWVQVWQGGGDGRGGGTRGGSRARPVGQ